jgi:preprotein translocase subunit YajC
VHVKVGDRVRTASGRFGSVVAVSELPNGDAVVSVQIDCANEEAQAALPYVASDLAVVRDATKR